LQVRNTILAFWIVTLVNFLISWFMFFVISQLAPLAQCFLGTLMFWKPKQRLKMLIICHWLTFTQEVKSNEKLNKFMGVFHCLTNTKLLEDNYYW
jgi:hypothetical protein